MLITAEQLQLMEATIGVECSVGVMIEPSGIILGAFGKDGHMYSSQSYSFDEIQGRSWESVQEDFCQDAAAFFVKCQR